MLYQSSSGDRSITESLYGEVFNRFYEAFDSSIRLLLVGCSLGLAPSPTGVKTFFIVAPNQEVAEQLIESIDSIISEVIRLMPGVNQTSICFQPPDSLVEPSFEAKNRMQSPSQFMVGKIFSHSSDYL